MDTKGNIRSFPDALSAHAAGFDTLLKTDESKDLLKLPHSKRHMALRVRRHKAFEEARLQRKQQRKARRRARRQNRR